MWCQSVEKIGKAWNKEAARDYEGKSDGVLDEDWEEAAERAYRS